LSIDELQALGDSIFEGAWRALPPNILTVEQQQQLLSYKWSISEAIAAENAALVESRAKELVKFLEDRTRAWEETREQRIAAARQLATSGIAVSRSGQPLAGPWRGLNKPELEGGPK
jgi:hypothetical protein